MTQPIRFEPAAVPPGTFHVASLRGEEAVSRPYRFELDLVSSDPDLPLDDLLGSAAVLWLGERRIEGIVAEIDQGDAAEGGFRYRALVTPRLWLASLDVRSRMFQGLSVPDMALAALAEVKVRAELRLSRAYGVRSHAVQYRESTLDFVSRLLAAEGIAYHFEQGEGGERVVLTDDNGGFHDRAAASLGAGGGGAVALLSLGSRRRVAPRAVLLHNDSLDPDAPIEAQATVDERGVGLRVEHAGDLTTPERAAAAADVAAGALRAESTRYSGLTRRPVHAGQVLDVSGHFRRDMNRAYLVVEARHTFDGGEPQSVFEAVSADVPYRTRPLPKPRVDGFVEARVDAPPDGGAAGAGGGCRVRLPFDLGAPGEGRGSPSVSQMAPGGGLHFPMKGGTPVMVGFVEGDPDRPVIAGAAQGGPGGARRARPGRVLFETSAPGGAPARSRNTRMDGALPEERPLAAGDPPAENVTQGTDNFGSESQGGTEFVRFAVPQGGGKWSYLRYGDVPSKGVSSPEGEDTFSETVLDGDFTSKHIDGDGNTDEDNGFTFKLTDLDDEHIYGMHKRSGNSPGSSSHFASAQSQGVFDYTDDNRTVITQGDHQTITAGHRTDVILGDYRIVIPKRTQGVYDADEYYIRFFPEGNSFRKTEVSHVKSNSVLYGDSETLMMGFQGDMTLGTDVSTFVGLGIEATLGFDLEFDFGYKMSFGLGHTWTKAVGKNISSAATQSIEASNKIAIQIPKSGGFVKDRWLAMASTGLAAGIGLTLAEGLTEFGTVPNTAARAGVFTAAGVAFIAAVVLGYYTKQEEPTEEDPSILLTKEKIELSIGTSSIRLTKDEILLETGEQDSIITLKKDELALASGEMQLMLHAGQKQVNILAAGGLVGITANNLFVDGNGQFQQNLNVIKNIAINGTALQVGTPPAAAKKPPLKRAAKTPAPVTPPETTDG